MSTRPVVHVVVPEGVDDPTTPSGGNLYDRRLCEELTRSGWTVGELPVPEHSPETLAGALAGLPDGALTLVDGLVAVAAPHALLDGASRLRIVVLVHMPFGERDRDARSRERQVLSAVTAVVTTSEWSRRWVLGHYGLRPWNVHVAPPGVDPAGLAAGSGGGGRLLCVAAVTRDKGHDVLLEAMASVSDLPWRLTCAGSLSRDRVTAERRQRDGVELGIADRVSWTDALSREELDKAYAEADALVLASRAESWGMVVSEALAHGLPVLATDVGGVREALGHSGLGRPGLLVPPADVRALAVSLRHWLEDEDLRAVLRRAARTRRTTLTGLAGHGREGLGRARGGGPMSRRRWAWIRLAGGFAILVVLVWRLGSGPFLDGVRTVDTRALAIAAVIALGTTVCCAWRWSVVVHGLGVGLPMRAAVASYYRSQFLNSTLPGGVLGDVHRAVHHGRETGDLPRGARAVVWDRVSGQGVQLVLTVVVLLALPSPVRSSIPVLAGLVVVGAGVLYACCRNLPRTTWPVILVASSLAVVGHVTTFLVAARTVGATTSTAELLPLALLVLVAMGIPANVAGWGPREGVAAWAFAAAGLGAAEGVAVAVVYGVMVFVASLPGAVVLVVGLRRRPSHA